MQTLQIREKKGNSPERERISILFELENFKLLVETPPDIRGLLLKNEIMHLDAIFVTHGHYDHSAGLKEFKYWREDLDVFCENGVAQQVVERYRLYTAKNLSFIPYYPSSTLYFSKFEVIPFFVHHAVPCYGLLINCNGKQIAYTSDTSERLTNYTKDLLEGIDLLIVNTPEFDVEKEFHISVLQALDLKEKLGVKEMVITHINHNNKPHNELKKFCKDVVVSYDGMEMEISDGESSN